MSAWLRQGVCVECEAVAYLRRGVGPAKLQQSAAWRAYVAGGCRGVVPAVAEVLWVRYTGDLPVSAWPAAISDVSGLAGLLELLDSTTGAPVAPPVCPACRAGAAAAAG